MGLLTYVMIHATMRYMPYRDPVVPPKVFEPSWHPAQSSSVPSSQVPSTTGSLGMECGASSRPLKGRAFSTPACAARTLAAATRRMASVSFPVFPTLAVSRSVCGYRGVNRVRTNPLMGSPGMHHPKEKSMPFAKRSTSVTRPPRSSGPSIACRPENGTPSTGHAS